MSFKTFILFLISLNWHTKIITAQPCIIDNFENVNATTSKCYDILVKNITVPAGQTLVFDLLDSTNLVFDGHVDFQMANWDGPLMYITGNRLAVSGTEASVINGNGQLYWDGKGGLGSTKPIFVHIANCTNSVFKNLYLLNCPMHCTHTYDSANLLYTDWYIDNRQGHEGTAPTGKEGHNTDGFFIYTSTNITVKNSRVDNQDDCVVVRSGSNMLIHDMLCIGSHGLSLSVGDSKTSIPENTVRNITFRDSVMRKCGTAIHIKTHNDGGPGSITDVLYQNITFSDINNYAIEVQQNYANGGTSGEPLGNIPITNLVVDGLIGSMTGEKSRGVYVVCAKNACTNWHWSNINVTKAHLKDSCNYKPAGFDC